MASNPRANTVDLDLTQMLALPADGITCHDEPGVAKSHPFPRGYGYSCYPSRTPACQPLML